MIEVVKLIMNNEYIIKIYEEKKRKYGNQAYRYISEILKEIEELHKNEFKKSDLAQSLKPFKGHKLEMLIQYIIADEIKALGLEIINGNKLEKTNEKNLTIQLSQVKRNLLVDFNDYGYHLPDVDLVIFEPKTSKVIAVLSSKVTLRERIAQTGYWKIKLAAGAITKHIKVFFVTLDEDKTLLVKKPAKKARAIVEIDTDGSYVLSKNDVEESNKVKMFDKFIDDLKILISK